MSYLTADEQQELKDYEDMFATPGWKCFHARMVEAAEQSKDKGFLAKDSKELHFFQGEFRVLSQIINYQNTVTKTAFAIEDERLKDANLDKDLLNDQRLADANI